jgi:lipid-A-disaccharide synthase-like uncharacterized protein
LGYNARPAPPKMPEKIYTIELVGDIFILVYFITEKGEVGNFVVKLNMLIG